jgi:group I intron endonuclease
MRGIYSITNTITGTIYYGQSVNINKRFGKHKSTLNNNKHDNDHLQNAWNKYGKENFEFKPIEIIEDATIDLTPIEIKYYYSTDNKYNLQNPKSPFRPEWKQTEEWKQKESDRMKGNNLALGHRDTEEQKKQKSKSHAGKEHSEDTKLKIAKSMTGKTLSDEVKQKISISKQQYWAERRAAKVAI